MNGKKYINNMFLIFITIILTILFVSCDSNNKNDNKVQDNREKAYKSLSTYLQEKYKEEFVISYLAKRNDGKEEWYEGKIYPKRYEGTTKMNDSYYSATGYYDNKGPGDSYSKLLFLESLSEHFRPKLEEQFGKNVLSIFNLEISFGHSTYESYVKSYGEGPRLEGAVYIFGSIKNEEDIKKYQKGIFEFVQYLKAEDNNFDYTKIAFIVIDERVLEDDFYDLDIKDKLINAKDESKTEKEFLTKREKIMRQIKVTNRDKRERIEEINRGDMVGSKETYFAYPGIAGAHVVSPKMMESKGSFYERIYKSEVGKTYDNVEEICLDIFTSNYLRRSE